MRSKGRALVIVVCLSGMFLAGYAYGSGSYSALYSYHEDFDTSLEEPVTVQAEDQEVVFLPRDHPDMQKRVGYVYTTKDNSTMYLQAGRTVRAMYETCNHEEMHNRGVLSNEHDYIYDMQGMMLNDLCLKAIYGLGQVQATQ